MLENLYYIYGSTYDDCLKQIKKTIQEVEPNISDYIEFDMEESNVLDLVLEAKTYPFFEPKKVIIVSGLQFIEASPEVLEFINYIKNPNEETILFLNGADFKLSDNELSKQIKLSSRMMELTSNTPLEYAKALFLEANLKPSIDVLDYLVSRVSNRILLEKEIEKLIIYSDGNEITKETIDLLVCKSLDDNIFDLLNALITKNKKDLMRIYYDLIRNSDDSMFILNMISKKFNEILTTKTLLSSSMTKEQIADKLHITSGRAFYMIKTANQVSNDVMYRFLRDLNDLDYRVKSGSVDIKTGLEILLLEA